MKTLKKYKFLRALCAEYSKLWTLPAIWWTIFGTFMVNIILVLAFASGAAQGKTGTQNILDIGLASISYTQAGFIILGILAVCSEYSGGQIRMTLTTIPWRRLQLTTKILAFESLLIPTAFITSGVGVLITNLFYNDVVATVSMIHLVKTLLSVTAYLALTALLSAGISILVRRTTPSLIGILVYYFIFGPILREHLEIAKYFPDTAGIVMWFPQPENTNVLTPLLGTLFLIIWVTVVLMVSFIVYQHRDI